MVLSKMWSGVRVFLLGLGAATAAGCGLVLDTSPPNSLPDGGVQCFSDAECSQSVCGGYERCIDGLCLVKIDPLDCDDGLDCTVDECVDEGCRHVPDDGACDPGEVCIPAEGGCVTPRACDVPEDCDDANVCTAPMDCVDNLCVLVPGSTDLVCPPYTPGGCGVIGCDPAAGCQMVDTDDSLCEAFEDSFECTETICDPSGACIDEPNDGICASFGYPDCFVPSCTPNHALADFASGCVFRPDDDFCANADPVGGCVESICAYTSNSDSDGCLRQTVDDVCGSTGATCDLGSGLCEATSVISCGEDDDCDDGDPCNGFETCNLGSGFCQAGAAPCQADTGDCHRFVCVADLLVPGDPASVCLLVATDACFGAGTP